MVQPAIKGNVRAPDGSIIQVALPLLLDCPVVFPRGGGVSLTFPLGGDDECLVVFSQRCIDAWWQNGFVTPAGGSGADGKPMNVQNNPPEFRMHSLSDGFAIVGVRSKARAFSQFDANTARLRTDDDSCYLEFDPTNKKLNGVFPGGITLNGVTIDTNGNVVTAGNITGATVTGTTQVVAGSGGSAVHLATHTHPSNGAPPTPGT